jgi:uncharacterized phiE125 gp8 family phage protein
VFSEAIVSSFGYGYPFTSYSNLGLYGAIDSFATLNLTNTSPQQSFVEPLDVDLVKDYLKIPLRTDFSFEDDQIGMFISGAREQAEILQNRDLVKKQWDLSMDYWPSYRLEMRTPTISVDLLQYKDSNGALTTMVENTDYIVDVAKQPAIVAPPYNGTWPTFTPWPSSSILLRFTSGYSNTDPFWSGPGARIKQGMLRLISDWYNNRLPFEKGASAMDEYPYAVTSCLSYGALVRAR